jgi:hypothetical protein
VAFFFLGLTPAADEVKSQGRTIDIYVATPGAWESGYGSAKVFDEAEPQNDWGRVKHPASTSTEEPRRFNQIKISLPLNVAQRQDFSISLDLRSRRGDTEEEQFLLSSSSSAIARSSDRCESLKVPDGFSGACMKPSVLSSNVTWDLTPIESGILIFTLTLPNSEPVVPTDIKAAWEGYVFDTALGKFHPYRTFKAGDRAFDVIVRDDIVVHNLLSVDLARQQIRIPVVVVYTLGMTRATYDWVALLRTCISAFLGTGLLWQILSTIRTRREQKEKQRKPIIS